MDYAILRRQSLVPAEHVDILVSPSLQQLKQALPEGIRYGIDLETNGLDAADPAIEAVGIGLANDQHCVYVDLLQLDPICKSWLKLWLARQSLVAFNLVFDSAFLLKFTGRWLNYQGDSYALYKSLSSEGHPGQKWNLESAQLNVLGWPTSNKGVLEAALAERGLTKAEMWKLSPQILGHYCGQDALAAWQLWSYLERLCKPTEVSPGSVPA